MRRARFGGKIGEARSAGRGGCAGRGGRRGREREGAREAAGRQPAARPAVGLLLASIHRGSSAFLWPGVAAEAERADANLFCFPGGQLNAGGEWEAQRNAVYGLVGPESLDGLISWASSLGGSVDPQALLAFHRDLPSLPLVTIGWSPGGSPSVTVDTYRGMQELLRHLIEEHGYRTLAFIRGPRTHVSADERFQAYLDVLSRCGIERRDELISDPLPWDAGEEGVRQLVDRRGLRPGRDFQALAAASDLLIFDAVRTLQSRGFRVPEDLAAAGFNNITESRLLSPAVTTVAVPFREQGVRAFRLLQGMLRGGGPARSVRLPTRLVIRESCGCPSARLRLAAEGPVGRGASGRGHRGGSPRRGRRRASIARADIAREGAALLGDGAADGAGGGGPAGADRPAGRRLPTRGRVRRAASGEAARGAASRERPRSGGPAGGAFLPLLRDALERVIHAGGAVPPWQDLVSVLRRRALASPLKDAAGVEGLCSQARVMISEAVERSATLRAWAATQRDQQLRELGKQLLMTLDLRRLGDVLRESLPRLGIASGYLAVYSDSWDRPRLARLLLGFTEEGWVIDREDPPVFPVRQLVPRRFLPRSRRYTYLVLPLFHQDQPLGYAVLEAAASSLPGASTRSCAPTSAAP